MNNVGKMKTVFSRVCVCVFFDNVQYIFLNKCKAFLQNTRMKGLILLQLLVEYL